MNTPRDLAALRQMTAELSEYLLSEVVLWPLGGSADYPKLSLGSYWLTRRRLSVSAEPALPALIAEGEAVLARWAATAERKAAAELPMRVNLWTAYLGERRGRYATEVTQRVIISVLWERYPALAETPAARQVVEVEAALRAQPAGAFVWEAALAPAFPEPEFWMLRRSR